MRFNIRTVSRLSLFFVVVFLTASECSIVHRAHRVRVLRESAPEKTRLADGTKFERFVEKGDVPPLPIEDEEEADDLNDPRIGHLDKDGGIAVPVDSHGRVLKGYEYLLKPITIDLDLEETIKNGPSQDRYEIPVDSQNGEGQKDYKPYPNNQDLAPKSEFLPKEEEQETNGEEYDDVESEPKEPLPNVPDLPKPDYSYSGESDDDLKEGEGDGKDKENVLTRAEELDDLNRRVDETIVPSSNIELPISRDNVDEKNKSADEVERETEIQSDEDVTDDRTVDIPSNRFNEEPESTNEREDNNREQVEEENGGRDENEIELTEDDVEELAKDFGKGVFDNVMNKASEFGGSNFASEDSDNTVDPNSISAQGQLPQDSDSNSESSVVKSGDMDGVVLPDQDLTDDEIAEITADSLKPVEPIAPEIPPQVPRSPVRSGRIGSGVQPDSATQHNVFIQFFLVSLIFLLL